MAADLLAESAMPELLADAVNAASNDLANDTLPVHKRTRTNYAPTSSPISRLYLCLEP